MSVRVKIEVGQDAGRIWRLREPGTYVVGRDPASALRVLDMKVSKGHCEIVVATDGVWLRDLKSTHGTQLNGQPVARDTALKAGDEIRVGFTVLRLLSDGTADAVAAPNGPPHAQAPAGNGAGAAAASAGHAPAAAPASSPGHAPASAASGNGAGASPPRTGASPAGPGASPTSGTRELPPDELVGKELAGYRVLKKIGQGGMGAVYIAEQVSLKREVALKVLSEKFVADSAFVDQFLNEARAAGALNHPNVVQVYDVGQVDGRYFFSMEFVPGGAIEDRIRGQTAEWSEALNWFLDAANALIFAGKRGILHRDVKPDNLMLAEDGSAKLCDLGLAKKSESADLLAQGIIGTPHFISPEAIRRKSDIDGRTDLYSLGCTFYRILTGENPYPAKTVKDILLGHLNKPVPRVSDRKPDVPKDLSDVVYKLMQKEPADRYASADDLYDALDKIRIQHGLAAHGIRPSSRKPLVVAIVIALAAAAAVGYVLTRPPEIQGPSAEDIARRKQAEADAERERERAEEGERTTFVAEAKTKRLELVAEMAGGRMSDTWKTDPGKWERLVQAFEELKKSILDDARFGSHEDVVAVADTLTTDVKDIRKELATLAKVDLQLQQAKAARAKEVGQAVLDRVAQWKRHLEPPQEGALPPWWEAAAMLAREPMKEFVAGLKGRRIELEGSQFPLIADADVDKAVALHFTGLDWPGQDQWKKLLLEEAVRLHLTQMSAAEKLAEPKTIEGCTQAAERYEAYAESVKAPDPTRKDEVNDLLGRHRAQAQTRARALRAEAAALLERQYVADRAVLFQLISTLREPGRGAFWQHVFPAREAEAGLLADALQRAEYRALGAELMADGRALTALFNELVTSFAAKQWADLDVEVDDGKKARVTDVAVDGITCPAKTKRSYVELGPAFLLKRVFYAGETPRFAFSGEALRGLAVLAEMAGDEALAQEHWKAYQAQAPAGQEQAVMRRLGVLKAEMEAARLWLEMQQKLAEVEDFAIEAGLPDPPKPPLSDLQRDKLLRARESLRRAVNEAGMIKADLENRVDLARTFWGASVRDAPHPKAGYAGEDVAGAAPPAPPGTPPAPPGTPPAPPGPPPAAPPDSAPPGPAGK